MIDRMYYNMNKTKSKIKRFLDTYNGKLVRIAAEDSFRNHHIFDKRYQKEFSKYKIIYISYMSVCDNIIGRKDSKLNIIRDKIVRRTYFK